MNTNQQLSVFGWNWSFLGDIQLKTDSEGNVSIANSGIQSLFPKQLSGTALYGADIQGLSAKQLANAPYDLSTQQLLAQGSGSERTFELQADGSYKGQDKDKSILTKEGNIYRLKEKDGIIIVFRTDGQLDYVQDANGYRITAGYTNERLTSLSATDGDSFTLSYNPQGRISAITDQTGQTTTYIYDSTGQFLTSITDSDGTTSFTYGHPYAPMEVTSITYADGTKITYDYDEFGRLQQVIQGEGRQALSYFYTYDANGGYNLTAPSSATTTVTYNATTNSRTVTDLLGRTFQYNYDANGLLDTVTGADGYKVDYNFCECGQLRSLIDPLGNQTTFNYEPNFGKLQSVTDARGNDLIYGYDPKGNLASITYEDGSQQSYNYNANGQLIGSSNRREQDITYEYNAQYQLVKETHENGSSLSYTYDSSTGLIKSITDSLGTTQVNYDQANNKLSIIYPNGRSVSYIFDDLGRRTQLVTIDGSNLRTVNYTYDVFGHLDKLTDGTNNLIVDYTYDSAGRLQIETNGNGTCTNYGYDAANQTTSIVNYAANGSINSRFDYTYDALGQRTSMTTLDGTWNYTYDLAGQLTRAVFASTNVNIASQDLTYVYDAAGNRIQTIENGVTNNYQTNNLNQYTTAGAATYNYDTDGNLISKTEAGKSWMYSYDDKNCLIQVIDPNNNKTQYEYDVFGNRNATIYNGQRTEYLVDPFGMGGVLAEYDSNGNQTAQYTHGLGLVSRTSGESTAFYDFDAIGSTVGLTGVTGTTLNHYSYRPFGEDFYEVETVANSFEYVGQFGVMEEANGLDFMRARYYTSSDGRFLNPDPIGINGGLNLYAYTGNSPVSFIDPSGKVATIWGGNYQDVGIFLRRDGNRNSAISWSGDCTSGPFDGQTSLMFGIKNNPLFINTNRVVIGAVFGFGVEWNEEGYFDVQTGFTTPGISICRDITTTPSPLSSPYARDAQDEFDRASSVRAPSCPLVLDLDGDGIELTALGTPIVRFDLDADGFREATGWVKPDDGLLVYDRNNDKFINDISELFGNQTTGGFAILRQLDSNTDGAITAADTAFTNLQIWRDLDSDGRSDVNELYSLGELGITRIDAVGSSTNITNAGNRISETANFTLANGTQRQIANVWFALDQLNSYYDYRSTYNQPITITNEILSLPTLKGYGNLPDLHISMAKDSQLLALVKTFTEQMSQENLASAGEQIKAIFFRWAGVEGINPASRGGAVDARELGFLEKFMGRAYSQGGVANPQLNAVAILSQTYERLVSALAARLVAQATDISVVYDFLSDELVFSGDITQAKAKFEQMVTEYSSSESLLSKLEAVVLGQYIYEKGAGGNCELGNMTPDELTGSTGNDKLYGFRGQDTLNGDNGNDELYGGTGDDILLGGADNDFLDGGEGDDLLDGNYGSDTINGSTGNDTLKGYADNDTYHFARGDGQDLIEDFSHHFYAYSPPSIANGGNDTLAFTDGINRTNLSWNFDGKELSFTLNDSPTDKITIQNYFDSRYRIENFTFAGAELPLTLGEIMTAQVWKDFALQNSLDWRASAIFFDGSSGNDSITTGDYADKLFGSDDNDTLTSNGGNDTLDGGTGNDRLNSGNDSDLLDGGNGDDLLDGSFGNDSLIGGIGNDTLNSGRENDFLDGGEGDDLLDGNYGSDTINGSTGNDTLKGYADNDTYHFARGDGQDLIEDFSHHFYAYSPPSIANGGNDTLAFTDGINRTNLSWNFDGKELSFTLNDSPTDKITIQNCFDSRYRIENFTVAGNFLTLGEIMTAQVWKDSALQNSLDWRTSAIFFDGSSGNDSITTGDYADKLFGSDDNDTLTSNGGNDTLDGGTGNDRLNSGNDSDLLDGGNGDDLLDGGSGNDILIGSAGNDTLDGSVGDDLLDGSAGEDVLNGGESNDILTGGADSDLLKGGSGNDTLTGEAGNDFLDGSFGNDSLNGGEGNDSISGSSENDFLDGGEGDDLLDGGSGNDTLTGGAGNDLLKGGAANDTYRFECSGGEDFIRDEYIYNNSVSNGGTDILIFGEEIARSDLSWSFNGTDLTFSIVGSSDQVKIQNMADAKSQIENFTVAGLPLTLNEIMSTQIWFDETERDQLDWLSSAIAFDGLAGDDRIVTGSFADRLFGGEGNDTISAGSGNDTLDGGVGDDTLDGGQSNDSLIGGEGNDTLNGGSSGNDILIGGIGNDLYNYDASADTIVENANEGIDTVQSSVTYTLGTNLENLILAGTGSSNGTGNALNNIIKGNISNNTLTGSDGIDTLIGSMGNDTYLVDTTTDTITENANEGIDTVQSSVTYTLGTNLENLTLIGTSSINGTGNTFNNVLTGNSINNILTGGDGDDTLIGGLGNDLLDGNFHDDALTGSEGNDTLIGGAGIDRVFESGNFNFTLSDTSLTGNGTDSLDSIEAAVLTGSSGNNSLNASAFTLGTVTLDGSSGNDTLTGSAGNDLLTGGAGNDFLDGGSGTDRLVESANLNFTLTNNSLTGNGTDSLSGIETLFLTGGSSHNLFDASAFNLGSVTLDGGAGSDSLTGGSDNDFLVGGSGNDLLAGGIGSDWFVYDTNAAFSTSAVGVERITDFTVGSDKLVLDKTTFTALTSTAGNGFSSASELAVVTSDTVAATAGALITYSSATGNLFYNPNGAAAGFGSGAQFATLTSIPGLTAADFVIQA